MSKITFPAVKGQIEQIMETVMAAPELVSLPDEVTFSLRLAIEELAVNVCNYAYPEGEDGDLCVEVEQSENVLTIKLADHGKPFDPLALEDPDVTLDAEEREIGGLGVFLVKQLMDRVEYQHVDGQNVMIISKNL